MSLTFTSLKSVRGVLAGLKLFFFCRRVCHARHLADFFRLDGDFLFCLPLGTPLLPVALR